MFMYSNTEYMLDNIIYEDSAMVGAFKVTFGKKYKEYNSLIRECNKTKDAKELQNKLQKAKSLLTDIRSDAAKISDDTMLDSFLQGVCMAPLAMLCGVAIADISKDRTRRDVLKTIDTEMDLLERRIQAAKRGITDKKEVVDELKKEYKDRVMASIKLK